MTLLIALLLLVATNAQVCPKSGRICYNEGECCSSEGWCGATAAHCANVYDFGNGEDGCPQCICDTDTDTDTETDIETDTDTEVPPSPPPTTPPVQEETEPFGQHCNCIIYGDPHTKMWNCAVNSWQGPHYANPPGDVYYMTRCADVETADMPFDIVGTIQRYDNYFTSLDYVKVILYDYTNDDMESEGTGAAEICIKNKGTDGVVYDNGCTGAYDETPTQNTIDSVVYDKFDITWVMKNGYSELYVDVKNNDCGIDLSIITQTATAKEEMTEIRVSDCYKPYSCGQCGDFYNTGNRFFDSDGNVITLSTGAWGGGANDETGLSYLVPGSMAEEEEGQRRLQAEPSEPCYGLREDIEKECFTQLKQYAECCWDRRDFCDDLIVSCGWDSCSCVMGAADSLIQANDENTVGLCVRNITTASMNFVCGLPPDGFLNPDMSIYDSVNKEEGVINDACVTCDVVGNIFIGIVIGCVIFGVIGALLYCFVVKPKLNGRKDMDRVAEVVEADEENTNTTR